MAWIYLVMAGIFEIGWVVSMKFAQGFTKLVPSLCVAFCGAVSLWLLTLAMKTLPMGTSYAVWTGIGAVGAMVAGVMLFGESSSLPRLVSAVMIIAGIIGLKLTAA